MLKTIRESIFFIRESKEIENTYEKGMIFFILINRRFNKKLFLIHPHS